MPDVAESVSEEVWVATQQRIAEILRTHQFDESRLDGYCFCGNPMGDQDEHQADALIQDGIVPLERSSHG